MLKTSCVCALLFATACGLEEEAIEAEDEAIADPSEEAGDIAPDHAPFGYSSWRTLTTPAGCSVLVRSCKTSTRINWEFGYNSSFYRVVTLGDGISQLSSNIDGQSWGSKYRTRAGTQFNWFFDSYNGCGGVGYGMFISQMPNC